MNRPALLALVLASGLGFLLVQQGAAELPARLTAAVSLAGVLVVGLLVVTQAVRRLPRLVLLVLGLLFAVQGLRALYFLLFHHWFTGGLYLTALAVGVLVLWDTRLGLPRLSRRASVVLAACCGLGLVVQVSGFPPRELLPTVRRWKHEPRTRTPLSLLGNTGLLGGLALFSVGGLLSLRPPQLEQR